MAAGGKDLEGGSYEEEEGLEGEDERAADEGPSASASRKGALQEKRGEEEEKVGMVVAAEGEEEEAEGVMELDEEKETQEEEAAGRKRAGSVADAFEEELRAQLEEYEQLVQEFQFQLEITRTRHSLATGGMLEGDEAGPAASTPSSAGFALCPSQLGPCGGSAGAPGWQPAALSLESQPGALGTTR